MAPSKGTVSVVRDIFVLEKQWDFRTPREFDEALTEANKYRDYCRRNYIGDFVVRVLDEKDSDDQNHALNRIAMGAYPTRGGMRGVDALRTMRDRSVR